MGLPHLSVSDRDGTVEVWGTGEERHDKNEIWSCGHYIFVED